MKVQFLFLTGLFWITTLISGFAREAAVGEADLILFNGKIITVDAADHIYQAIAIKAGKILKVGSDQEIALLAGFNCKTIDLKGKTVTPGLIDSHYHLMYYGQQFWQGYLNIRHPVVQSKADLLQVVEQYAQDRVADEWISGNQGFHLQINETLDRYDLDLVAPKNPVYLRHGSGQYAVVNSRALEIGKIDRNTPNPHSSLIMRDNQGEPTGVLSHYPAENLVAQHATGYGDRTEDQKFEDIKVGQELCLQAGYTSVQDVIVGSVADIQVYRKYDETGQLKVRLAAMLYINTEQQADSLAKLYNPKPANRFKFLGWKLAMDGGFAAKTILMYDKSMYASNLAYPYHDQETFNRIVQTLHNTGLQVAVHVSGDEGIDMTLNAFEAALRNNPRPDPRHRIEHGLFPSVAAWQRMQDSKIILSTQPQWLVWHGDGYIAATNPATMRQLLPLKTMLTRGIPLAFGCDVPASIYQEPKWAFAGAVFRRTQSGVILTSNERLTVPEALRVHTMGSAYAGFADSTTGSLEPGKFADLVIWSHDLYTMSGTELNALEAEMTIVNGEIVYDTGKNPIRHANGTWIPISHLQKSRQEHTATLLNDGKVLIIGWDSNQAEWYDPTTRTFALTGSTVKNHRQGSTATLLKNGKVLLVGGVNALKTAEIYDPETGTFSLTDTLRVVHSYHSATLLPDGRVLIAGGQDHNGPQTHAVAEIYDPQTGTFTLTDSLNVDRSSHQATLLPNGQVLITGGTHTTTPGFGYFLQSCELYDPVKGAFSETAGMQQPRTIHAATLLTDGKVLIVGGAWYVQSGECYDYVTGAWSATENMVTQRRNSLTATRLQNGLVLLAGGFVDAPTKSVEIYDPLTNTFSIADSLLTPRMSHTATLLANGDVLVAGGYDGIKTLNQAELYQIDPANVVAVEPESKNFDVSPQCSFLSPNYPNPFNSETHLTYLVTAATKVNIRVFNLRGEYVKTLVDKEQGAGEYQVVWDGTAAANQLVGSGIYLVRMRVGNRIECRKLVFLK